MTELTPPPPPPPSTGPATEEPAPARGRGGRRLLVGGVAAAAIVAAGGGAFAVWQKLDGGGAQPHDVLPSTVVAYARVDVDPSASQKVALLRLIRKFPDAAEQVGIKSADQDVRKLLFDEILSEGDCDLTYDEDVKPWIGSRIGIGLDTKQTPLVAVQVTDEDTAAKGLKALAKCGGESASVAFLDGYAIVAKDQKTADAAVTAAGKASLGDDKQFAADFDALGEQGVASGWVDSKALIDDVPELRDTMEDASPSQVKALEEAGTVATTLRVDGSTVEIAGRAGLTKGLGTKTASSLATLPADTVAAVSVGGLGDQIGEQYDTLLKQFTEGFGAAPQVQPTDPTALDPSVTEGMTDAEKAQLEDFLEDNPTPAGQTPQDYIDQLEDETGLRLPDDLETLFGDGLTVAVGSSNLETVPTLEGPDDLSKLDVALKMTTDPAKAIDLAQRLAALAAKSGVTLSAKQTDDGAVLATNAEAASAFGASGKLGESDAFKAVMPYGDDTVYGAFVDIGAVLDKVSEADPPQDVAEGIEEAKALQAFGISYAVEDKHTVMSIRLSLAD